jgi:hypothetical protein
MLMKLNDMESDQLYFMIGVILYMFDSILDKFLPFMVLDLIRKNLYDMGYLFIGILLHTIDLMPQIEQ